MLMSTHEMRLTALRKTLKARGLDGFIIPISDPHMSEYVGEYAERLKWLTGFGGSAGTLVVLTEPSVETDTSGKADGYTGAALFVDGRYTVQAREQVDARLFQPVAIAQTTLTQWLEAHVGKDAVIGHDPWLHSRDWVHRISAALEKQGASLIAAEGNPVDAIWADRPALPVAPAIVHGLAHAGKSSAEKLADIAAALKKDGLDACVMAALDSVAWTFNLRGSDIAHIPVVLSYAIIRADASASLFIDPAKLTDEVRAHLGDGVALAPYDGFAAALQAMEGRKVAVDPESVPVAVFTLLEGAGATVIAKRDPAILMKAVKNDTEIAGARAAHIRDGAALTRFLRWLSIEGEKGGQDELSAAAKLRTFRDETGCLVDLSFRTISATGPHGALPHYSVDEGSNIPIEPGQLYLVDSGGQYRDGTTDVTRVLAIGAPGEEMRRRYTEVLKGHIALASAIFPKGTRGGQLDVLARQYLWASGVDFAHGTGHGVGSFLSVHEGPQRISGAAVADEPLQPGMILSNEPGYYKEGAFGIRIENLELVVRAEIEGAEGEFYRFEALTLAPLEPKLIDLALLSPQEKSWVDAYHQRVRDVIGPLLDPAERAWLDAICAPLG